MKSAHSLSLPTAARPESTLKIALIGSTPEAAREIEQLCRSVLGSELGPFVALDPGAAASVEAYDAVLVDPDLTPDRPLDLQLRAAGGSARSILVSARSELAVSAFDCGVLDFVPKPVRRERLAKALGRVRRLPNPGPNEIFLAVRKAGRIDLVPLEDVMYVEGADKYSELVLANGRRNFHDSALGDLEATLPPSFVRIHKSYLVRFALVSRLLVLKGSRYFAELKDGRRLPVGRSRYRSVKSRLLWPQRHG
jgi:DNA-binding LytR/AlgR family response regulator